MKKKKKNCYAIDYVMIYVFKQQNILHIIYNQFLQSMRQKLFFHKTFFFPLHIMKKSYI